MRKHALSLFGVIVERNVNNVLTLHMAIFVLCFTFVFAPTYRSVDWGCFRSTRWYRTERTVYLVIQRVVGVQIFAPLAYNFSAVAGVVSPIGASTTFFEENGEHIPEAARFNTIVPGFLAIYCSVDCL